MIKILPEEVVRKIAAGEVVERPASVLKELLENSLDAQAKNITVEIKGTGQGFISVADDGCGMSRDDLGLAVKPHATSKIACLEDLDSLSTLGFRGEALPSIASVSKFEIATRRQGEPAGWWIRIEGGKTVKEDPFPRQCGTTVMVRDLFYNVPARAKFLKSFTTERAACLKFFESLALSRTDVSFKLIADGHNLCVLPSSVDVLDRAIVLWGNNFKREDFHAVNYEGTALRVSGYVSGLSRHQSSQRWQRIFVNGRIVNSKRISQALYRAYFGSLPHGRHPVLVIFVNVDPKLVDVNVHPSKQEVKFSEEDVVCGGVYKAVRDAMNDGGRSQVIRYSTNTLLPDSVPSTPSTACYSANEPIADYLPFSDFNIKDNEIKPIAQIGGVYIVTSVNDGMIIIDQHAAAERVLYERYQEEVRKNKVVVQSMAVPVTWDVDISLADVLRNRTDFLNSLGFVLEPFGGRSYLVKGLPVIFGKVPGVLTVLNAIVEALAEERKALEVHDEALKDKMARAACRAAVKARDKVQPEEMAQIIEDLKKCDEPNACPHGRPTMVNISFRELARRFHRT